MRTFRCVCGARVFFVNHQCLRCGRDLAFLPDRGEMAPVHEAPDGGWRPDTSTGLEGSYRRCDNHLDWGVCNWLVPDGDAQELCQACRLNSVIPDLSVAGHRELWADVEQAKRHLIYTLNQLGLPVRAKAEVEWGMAFQLLKSNPGHEVLTGHAEGLITLNLDEADDLARERARLSLREGYRTVLGHLRHEVGHYYWDLLVRDTPHLSRCRELFGDEQRDYARALDAHYSSPPPTDWQRDYISVYATAHPWEDWAETWAHLLHMVDTMETAGHFGLRDDTGNPLSHPDWDIDQVVASWSEVTVAMNALNRSMGMPDAYPFAISDTIKHKLAFVAEVVRQHASALPGRS